MIFEEENEKYFILLYFYCGFRKMIEEGFVTKNV